MSTARHTVPAPGRRAAPRGSILIATTAATVALWLGLTAPSVSPVTPPPPAPAVTAVSTQVTPGAPAPVVGP